jgi:hypothetical protein
MNLAQKSMGNVFSNFQGKQTMNKWAKWHKLLKIPRLNTALMAVILLSGCSTHDGAFYKNLGAQVPSLANGFTGGIIVEPLVSDQELISKMQARCSDYGGLDRSSLRVINVLAISGEKVYEYKCLKSKTNLSN